MAPEQGLGKEVDHRGDIYALGIVAYEMLTGRPPYDGDSPVAVMMKHATAPLPGPSRALVPETLVPVLRKALAKEPEDRWSTATEFARALETGVAVPAVERRVAPIAAGAAGLAVAAAVGVLVLTPPTPPTDEEPETSTDTLAPALPVEAATEVAPPVLDAEAPDVETSPPTSPSAGDLAEPAEPVPGQAAPVPPGRGQPSLPATPTVATASALAPLNTPVVDQTEPAEAAGETAVVPPVPAAGDNPMVGPDGDVTEVEVTRSVHPLLDDAARAAVLRYTYTPGLATVRQTRSAFR